MYAREDCPRIHGVRSLMSYSSYERYLTTCFSEFVYVPGAPSIERGISLLLSNGKHDMDVSLLHLSICHLTQKKLPN